MDKTNLNTVAPETADATQTAISKATDLPKWETPKLEDVSEQVMAQPYIRFT